ncbi:hypothetical protein GP115_004344 [Salmonella enterica]|nr:hypothetical protein [Salmonella enterica]EDZ1557951.1 hypothetical protein [Salmonella enterica]EDZ7079488.1 hypothetical protein [Salmonella enterica]
MGAQKGAHEHAFLFISFIFNLLCCVLSPAFAPSDAIISCLRVAFLCPFLSRFVYICL